MDQFSYKNWGLQKQCILLFLKFFEVANFTFQAPTAFEIKLQMLIYVPFLLTLAFQALCELVTWTIFHIKIRDGKRMHYIILKLSYFKRTERLKLGSKW